MPKPETYTNQFWHLVDTRDPNLLHHNAKLAKGVIHSVSHTVNRDPKLEGIVTLYSLLNSNNPKEKLFEAIRANQFNELPSRFNAFYVFDDYQLAERASGEWFSNNNKEIEECQLLPNCKIHKADTGWLDCKEYQWEDYAHKYWGGKMCESPFPEILVEGTIFFPSWKEYNLLGQ